jgi:hypothetical protein
MMHFNRHDLLGPGPDTDLRLLTLEAMASFQRERRLEAIRAAGHRVISRWLSFAERNRVGPIVAHALLEAWGDEFPQADVCRARYQAEERRMVIMMAALDDVAERLSGEGIRMVALKNAGIARGIYPHLGCCPMGDLDVLVDRDRFREAHRLIEESGFILATRGTVEAANLEEGLHSGGTEYRKIIDGEEVWFELQWRPVAGRWIRQDQEPPGKELIARSVAIKGTQVRLLNPQDNMIQVGLHTAKHSYVRAPGLRLHTDVDRLAIYQAPPWEKVIRLAREYQIQTATFFSFALARLLLQSPVPDHVLEALAPSPWKQDVVAAMLCRADIFEPDEKKFNRSEMLAFHALLYDDAPGLVASVFDSGRGPIRVSRIPHYIRQGLRRMTDVVTRYQR